MTRWRARSPDAETTRALGRILGETAPEGAVLLLEGPLGAGKTTLAQGVGAGCGVEGPIASPTYNLVLHYDGARHFTHVDLYRLDDPSDLGTLDLDEILDPEGVTCVEWPALLADRVRPPWGRIRIEAAGSGAGARLLAGAFAGEGWGRALASLDAAGAESREAGREPAR